MISIYRNVERNYFTLISLYRLCIESLFLLYRLKFKHVRDIIHPFVRWSSRGCTPCSRIILLTGSSEILTRRAIICKHRNRYVYVQRITLLFLTLMDTRIVERGTGGVTIVNRWTLWKSQRSATSPRRCDLPLILVDCQAKVYIYII